jgi:glycosyltransferase involved in cell wall biosynthesis
MKSLCILCPVYREEAGIRGFHARLQRALLPLRERYAITTLYALDPSPDRTELELQALSAEDSTVETLVMSRRFGHQAALLAGMDECRADALVMLDSDGQHPPELIAELVARWEAGADIVQTLRTDARETSWLRRATSRWFYQLLQRVGSVELKSGAADFRLLSRPVLEVFRRELRERNPFVRGLISWVGFNICYVAFAPEVRAAGRSNYRASTLVNFALQGIASFSKTPLRACATLGLFIALLSFVSGAAQLLMYFLRGANVPGWASLFAALSFLGGVQLFFLGVIGEYVGLIFDEVKGRPRYLMRHRYRGGELVRIDSRSEPDPTTGLSRS